MQALVETSERHGIETDRILSGIFTRKQLQSSGERVAWERYADFLERLQEAWGGPNGMIQVAYHMIDGHPAMRLLAGLVLTPRRLYLSVCELMARRMYSNVGVRVEELPDGRVHYDMKILSARGSLPFGYGTVGCLRAYPRLLGYPDAVVSAQISPHHSHYVITLPPVARFADRAAALSAGPKRPQLDLGGEDLGAVEIAFDDSGLLRDASSIGQTLAALEDLETFSNSLFEILARFFVCRWASLWVRDSSGERCVKSVGAAGGSRPCRRTLTLDGREVGRLEADLPGYVDESATPMLDAILPWIAVGVDRCLKKEPDAGPARLAEAASAWRLSRRQGQVLELLAQGCQNKEIAVALGCSPRTVEVHVSEVLRRAGAPSRAALLSSLLSQAAGRS